MLSLLFRLATLYHRWRHALRETHPDEVRARAERAARDRLDIDSRQRRACEDRIRLRWAVEDAHDTALHEEQLRVEAEVRARLETGPLRFRRRG